MPATATVHASTVVGVPPCAAAALFSDVMFAKEYGVNGLMSCCLLENSCAPTDVGAVRRLALDIPTFEDKIIREKLVEVINGPHHFITRMEYLPCTLSDIRRSPFGLDGTQVLKSAITTFTVSEVTTNPNKCFLDVSTTFTANVALPPEGSKETRDELIFLDIKRFWKLYVDRTVAAASEYLLSTALPRVKRPIEKKHESLYEEVEDVLCKWSAGSGEPFSREKALTVLERVLNAWRIDRNELKHQEMLNSRLEDDFKGARHVAAAAAVAAAEALASAAESASKRPSSSSVTSHPSVGKLPPLLRSVPSGERHRGVTGSNGTAKSSERVSSEARPDRNKEKLKSAGDNDIKDFENRPFHSHGGKKGLSPREGPDSNTNEKRATPVPHTAAHQQQGIPALIAKFVTDNGLINEEAAQTLFSMLDDKNKGYLMEREVAAVLRKMDPVGLYEDVDGTLEKIAATRGVVFGSTWNDPASSSSGSECGPGGARRADGSEPASSQHSADHTESAVQKSQRVPRAGKPSVLQAMVLRYDKIKEEMKEDAIKARSAEMLRKYAFKISGRIHYDEFCLMMLGILRGY
uniref:WGS project CAEQ00000000 data, annotated contig 1532 n=1 Tax=Trypanosoma congolense (strain IL3000) TaxID=1068625 RepID=F9W6X3_TRYCI|nr:unnamed protein product [Trypanosoma congolense IL3000]